MCLAINCRPRHQKSIDIATQRMFHGISHPNDFNRAGPLLSSTYNIAQSLG